ncbi:hypothetical protein E1A91_A07G057100v1 [Gossypium mustelinum]|uniref:Uncharacterized protein n=1 Tax=Gossypium mustelinum TaxID=34275 RepID=A0A5D2YGG7_GOSMU|nr:hypothetical protein E1A91_A07G057100v1 [Gossypium mustelinum]
MGLMAFVIGGDLRQRCDTKRQVAVESTMVVKSTPLLFW